MGSRQGRALWRAWALGALGSFALGHLARVMSSSWQVVDGSGKASYVDDDDDSSWTEKKKTTTVNRVGNTVQTVTEYYEQRTTVKVLDPTTDTKPKPDDSDAIDDPDKVDPNTTITGGKMKGAHGVIKQINLELLF